MSEDVEYGKLPFGASSSNMTVASSTTCAPPFDSTPLNAESALEPLSGSACRLNVAATSAAVIGVPSWNFTPCLILNVHCDPSRFGFQLSARRGTGLRLRSEKIRNSPDWLSVASAPWLLTLIGSRSLPGVCRPVRSVPPFLTAALFASSPLELELEPPDFSPEPHAVARKVTSGTDIPTTAPRRMNSRRPMWPARYSSMMWFSSSLRCARTAST